MEEFDIENLVKEINFEENSIAYIKNDIVLTQKEIDVLKELDFNYESYTNMSSMLMALDEVVDDDPELEEVLKDISDRNYYMNVNK
jgi:hypothetical protein